MTQTNHLIINSIFINFLIFVFNNMNEWLIFLIFVFLNPRHYNSKLVKNVFFEFWIVLIVTGTWVSDYSWFHVWKFNILNSQTFDIFIILIWCNILRTTVCTINLWTSQLLYLKRLHFLYARYCVVSVEI